jgi:GntR family transcriptional regulator, transcriptional repressor for pyruvate dehydrogenase complex
VPVKSSEARPVPTRSRSRRASTGLRATGHHNNLDGPGHKKQNKVELVIEAIKSRLSEGAWKSGDRLPNEDELAAILHVSRTPLREAIKILDMANVLEIRRGTGTFVRHGSVASLSQLVLFQRYLSRATPQKLMEVRWLFERSCAELAAQRRTEDDLAGMRAAIDDLRALATPNWTSIIEEICEMDKLFHRRVYDAAKNELISTISNFVLDMVSPFMMRSLKVGGPWKTIKLHEMLYVMIENGNPAGAREITSMNAVDVNMNHFRENLEDVSSTETS